jgi:2-polyprenyl-3-methyl-5-hydroxy-6-metoxy-1,4-benzoquinol methylase
MAFRTAIRTWRDRIRWRLGLRVAAPELEEGTDESVARFYRERVTDCAFLGDPNHYEHPRAQWVLERVSGGRLLEIGCGNGGMTRLLAPRVDKVLAFDISTPSLVALRQLGLPNVEAVEGMVEHFEPAAPFDWIVMSEVLEHLRDPAGILRRCVGWLAPGGTLLLTTPHGHWESNEHLQEFTLERFASLLAVSGAETVSAAYLRDRDERRRWLVGEAKVPKQPAAADDFHDPGVTRRPRRERS